MARRYRLQGFPAIYLLSAILLIFLAGTIHYSDPALSTAIGATDKTVSQQLFNSFTHKSVVLSGEKVQIEFSLPASTDPRDERDLITHANELHKRDGLDWAHALLEGVKSVISLVNPRHQSQWTTIEQLKNSGWTVTDSRGDTQTSDFDGTPSPYNTLSIDRTKGNRLRVEQNIFYNNCHHQRNRPTNGYFVNIFNVPGRTLIATNNISPLNKLSNEDAPDPDEAPIPPWRERIPDITYWSEVAAIMWFDQAGDQANTLKYVFRYHIVTDDTKRIMNLAIQRYPNSGAIFDSESSPDTGTGFKMPWPGVVIKNGNKEASFQALLGTPHAKGVVQLLAKNPDRLGKKNIETITMFTSGVYDDYNLLFTLTD